MPGGVLEIDLGAIASNWRAIDALSADNVETAAVVKADAYGLGMGHVSVALQNAGARSFFVALAEEGVALRKVLGGEAKIYVFTGYMKGDEAATAGHDLIPLLNSPDQAARFLAEQEGRNCGLQLDTGMNRLGLEAQELNSLAPILRKLSPQLVMSHLACADEPDHAQNADQLGAFHAMNIGIPASKKSLAATGGTLLGGTFHMDMVRPGIGLYGGLPFAQARPVVRLSLPVVQSRTVMPGESVGYGATWKTGVSAEVATVSAGYADGLIRAMSDKAILYAGDIACPVVGRVSMDAITVDVSALKTVPDELEILNELQTVDVLAKAAGTIGYEILTSLGSRYKRQYLSGN